MSRDRSDNDIRVLLADDQAMVRAGFRMIIESEPDLCVVGEAADGREAVDAIDRCRPDVVLMDVRMPRMDGLEATAQITARPDAPRVLMLTTFGAEDYVYTALRAGASGFLLKDAPAEQLIDAIRVIHRGDALLAPSVTRMLIADIARRPAADPAAAAPGLDELTDRELEVMRLLARGLSNAEIADALYLGEATVKTHVGRVLAKLDLRDRVQAVVVAYESGLVTPGDHPPG
ncbi:MAG: response regulator transcription factor [Actinobacteria bacterium]|nr:response regulator transcription factor [Actinomycetota bacterium]